MELRIDTNRDWHRGELQLLNENQKKISTWQADEFMGLRWCYENIKKAQF